MKTQCAQLERESHKGRARLSQTLDELRARITLGQVVDQLADYARHGQTAEFLHNLARDVRENPLPLTLIGAGVAWLIIASSLSARARAQHCVTRDTRDIGTSATVESFHEEARRATVRQRSMPEAAGRPEDYPDDTDTIAAARADAREST
jgi:hypothetical protein